MFILGDQFEEIAPIALKGFRVVLLLLSVVLLGYICARSFWLIYAGPQIPDGAMNANSVYAGSEIDSTSSADIAILRKKSPFKLSSIFKPVSIAVEAEEMTEDAPETALKLLLNGVRTFGSGDGVAMITGDDNQQHLYHQGDAIRGYSNVKLDRVYVDGVILSRNGLVEKLSLYEASESERIKSLEKMTETNIDRPPKTPELADKQYGVQGKKPVPEQKPIEVSLMRSRLTRSEVMGLLGWARLDPKVSEGVDGLTIFPINSEIFKRSGFKSRDVIQTIGGIDFNNLDGLERLLAEAQSQSEIEVKLLRDAQLVNLRIVIDDQ